MRHLGAIPYIIGQTNVLDLLAIRNTDRYSDLPNRRIVVLNETMVKFCPIAKRDDPIN